MTNQVNELDAAQKAEMAAARNALGPIAESYDLLHNLPTLGEAKRHGKVPAGTRNSALQAVYQGVEVALLNLVQLVDRAAGALARGDAQAAAERVRWANGFHLVLRRLGDCPKKLNSLWIDAKPKKTYSLDESPAFHAYLRANERFEEQVRAYLAECGKKRGADVLEKILGQGSHTDLEYSILNLTRASAHEAIRWEEDLCFFDVDEDAPLYRDFVACQILQSAVEKSRLDVETCYTEFVALHQIPEMLSAEVNDHLEQAILEIRAKRLTRAQERLDVAHALLPPMVQAQAVMAACLSTADYHTFRDNLGLASGIHSLSIRHHLFKDLFVGLWNELEIELARYGGGSVEEAVRRVDLGRHEGAENWVFHKLLNSAFGLHGLFDAWRHEHLHMPRNCLGGGGTKSMIGVPDGLEAVKKMRDAANALPVLVRMNQARGLPGHGQDGPIARRHQTPDSLDSLLLEATGEATRTQFPHVQSKELCPFHRTEPPRQP